MSTINQLSSGGYSGTFSAISSAGKNYNHLAPADKMEA
jgi:hypothetical protein